jgi:hypothetical protein
LLRLRPAQPHGHQLKSLGRRETVAIFAPQPYHTSVPGFVYGARSRRCSIVTPWALPPPRATARTAAPRRATAPLSRRPQVDYLRPTPLGVPLEVRGRAREVKGRKVVVDAWLSARGEVCARGDVVAVEMPETMRADR